MCVTNIGLEFYCKPFEKVPQNVLYCLWYDSKCKKRGCTEVKEENKSYQIRWYMLDIINKMTIELFILGLLVSLMITFNQKLFFSHFTVSWRRMVKNHSLHLCNLAHSIFHFQSVFQSPFCNLTFFDLSFSISFFESLQAVGRIVVTIC